MFTFIALIFLLPSVLCIDPTPKELYTLETDVFPAFCKLIKNSILSGSPSWPVYDLSYTSFSANPRVLDPIRRIENVGVKYEDPYVMNATAITITDEMDWPNEVDAVPSNIFSLPYVWSAATGFFMPGKDEGMIALMDMNNGVLIGGKAAPVYITPEPGSNEMHWYYHRIEWHDMNSDGYMDIVTERANGGGPDANIVQLVWFENPRSYNTLTPGWEVHVLNEGVEDVYFRLHEMPYNGGKTTVVISSGFYSHQLSLVWSKTNDFSDQSSIASMVVDDYGWYFDVEIADVNNDGHLDILTSTWSQQGLPGAVIAYEIPDGDWTTKPWTRHILQDGYKSFVLAGTGSPGSANVFWPSKDVESEKPFIMVSGDDDGSAYVLTANSQDTTDWSYTQTTIYKGSGTIGGIAVGDVDHDGYAEVFIPSYTAKKIIVMSYRP